MSSHGFGDDIHRYNPDLYKYDDEEHPEDDDILGDDDYEEGSILHHHRDKKDNSSKSEESKFWVNYIALMIFIVSMLLLALAATNRSHIKALSGQVGSDGLLANGDSLTDVELPDIIQYNLVDWTPTIWRNYNQDMTPLFWHMPISGGNVIESALAGCLGLVMASGAARDTPQINDQELSIVTINKHQYINVDTSTRTGVMRAAELQLASSNTLTPNVIATPFFRLATASLFNPALKGRLFTVIRHPLHRALASYQHYLQTNNENNNSTSQMTLDEYVDSPHFVNNWMTRFLTGKFYSPLQNDDLRLSATILRTKTLVGLYEDMEETLTRFETYFDWTPSSTTDNGRSSRIDMCYRHQLQSAGFIDYLGNKLPASYQQKNVDVSMYVRDKLKYDLELYKIAKEVFDYQGFALEDTKDSFQLWDNSENKETQENVQAEQEEQKEMEEMNADYSQNQQQQQQQHITPDEILAFAEVDKPCILNGDFSEKTQNWYGIYADLSIVDGLFGNALKATNRQNQRRGGMWQNIRPDCLEVNRWYEVRADYYIEKAESDDSTTESTNQFHCDPAIMEGTSADACPGIGLRVGDELVDIGWSVGPLQDDTPGKMGWHEMYGAFKVTDDMVLEQLSIFVARAATDSDIIIDNVSLQPADHTTVGIRGCSSVIANGNAETGDYRYWFIKGSSGEDGGGGEIQMVQPGYGGYGYAFKHTGKRADRWKGMVQALDSTCFEVGTAWKITAKFRFFKNLQNGRGERPASCSKNSSYDTQSCPVFEVGFYTPGQTYHVSTGPLQNEVDTRMNLGEWNDIEHVFVVDYEMSTFTRVKIHINSVDPGFNYELDDVQMVRLDQEP